MLFSQSTYPFPAVQAAICSNVLTNGLMSLSTTTAQHDCNCTLEQGSAQWDATHADKQYPFGTEQMYKCRLLSVAHACMQGSLCCELHVSHAQLQLFCPCSVGVMWQVLGAVAYLQEVFVR